MRRLFINWLVVLLVLCNGSCGNSPSAQVSGPVQPMPASGASSAPPRSDAMESRVFAEHMLDILQRGDAHAFAAQMHYPPAYTPEERAKDIKDTGDDIEVALREFGSFSDVHPFLGARLCYTFFTTGGTVPYVKSLSPSFSAYYDYQVQYHVSGAGYVRISVMRLTARSPFEVRQVQFELPVSDPRALPEIANVLQRELEHKGIQVTPEIKKQIEASIKQGANGGGQ